MVLLRKRPAFRVPMSPPACFFRGLRGVNFERTALDMLLGLW